MKVLVVAVLVTLSLFVVINTQTAQAQETCTAEYAVQKFDTIGHRCTRDSCSMTAMRYNLVSVEVSLPNGQSPYVNIGSCPDGTIQVDSYQYHVKLDCDTNDVRQNRFDKMHLGI